METYIKAIDDSIQEQIQRPRKFYRNNSSREERRALVSLRSRTDIVIKKADKGSATVIMSREQYSETSIIRTSIIRTLDYPNTSPRSAHSCVNI